MRYIIFPLIVLFSSLVTKAQYCLIHDDEGFANVRETAGADGKIICQLNNGMVVLQSWSEDTIHKNWVFVEFYVTKEEAKTIKVNPRDWMPDVMKPYLLFTGYIYKDRLINIEQQNELKKKWSGNDFLLYNDSIKIKFTPASFQKEKHKIQKKDEYPVLKIDGHYIAGTDGGIPREVIKSFSIEINRHKVDIPKSSFYDLYEPNFNRFANGYIDRNGTLYIIMNNSDAAGSYSVIFVIKDNKYFTRYIFDGEC